jgi:hypothetical protein
MNKNNNFNKLYLLLHLLFNKINFTSQYNKESLDVSLKKKDKKSKKKILNIIKNLLMYH